MVLMAAVMCALPPPVAMRKIDAQAAPGTVEIRGLSAGAFSPALWQSGTPYLLADVRRPLIAPLPGRFRNIYAPSVVELPRGWRVFYGAWDGTNTPNDCIYSLTTEDT